jgi:hypothetical protein
MVAKPVSRDGRVRQKPKRPSGFYSVKGDSEVGSADLVGLREPDREGCRKSSAGSTSRIEANFSMISNPA